MRGSRLPQAGSPSETKGSPSKIYKADAVADRTKQPVNATFSTLSPSAGADVSHLRAEEGLAQARKGLGEMQGAPSTINKAEALAGMAVQAANTVRSFGNVWSSLMKTLTIVMDITDKLAEV